MAKAKDKKRSLLQELFSAGLYKGGQGKVARQVSFAALAITFALAAWRMYYALDASVALSGFVARVCGESAEQSTLDSVRKLLAYGIPMLVLTLGCWSAFRFVNYQKFADFLIAVEAEMAKVSWPSRGELYRSSMVVIIVIFSLAFVLAGFDLLWTLGFSWLGITS